MKKTLTFSIEACGVDPNDWKSGVKRQREHQEEAIRERDKQKETSREPVKVEEPELEEA